MSRVTAAIAATLLLLACGPAMADSARPVPGGDARRGAKLIARIGCGTCHEIPGIANAYGLVGPPLGTIAARVMIAGMLPNTPDNMVHWLQSPQSIVPGNAMPDMGLDRSDARDITAYLYTLH